MANLLVGLEDTIAGKFIVTGNTSALYVNFVCVFLSPYCQTIYIHTYHTNILFILW